MVNAFKQWILAVFFSTMVIGAALAQSPAIVWQSCQTLSSAEYTSSVCHTPGGYLVMRSGRYVDSGSTGVLDIFVSKFDTAGTLLWTNDYGGSSRDFGVKIVCVHPNLYYVAGHTKSSNGDVQSGNKGAYDLWVFAIDSTGTLLWEKTYGSPSYDFLADLVAMPDGSFYLGGNVSASGGDVDTIFGGTDVWLSRCDASGNIVWQKTYGAEGYNNCTGFIVNSKGNLVITGTNHADYFSGCYSPENQNIFILESDPSGNILWNRCYGSWGTDYGGSVVQYLDGYLMVATVNGGGEYVEGYHQQAGGYSPTSDIWLVRTDHQGFIVWKKCLGGFYDDTPASLVVDSDNGIYLFSQAYSDDNDVSGNHGNFSGQSSDIWMLKIADNGEVISSHCLGGNDNELLLTQTSVLLNNEKEFIVAANSKSNQTGDVACPFTNYGLWLQKVARCDSYEPGIPDVPAGDQQVIIPVDSTSDYSIVPPANAWGFGWKLDPDTAGWVKNLGLKATIHWSLGFKGTARVSARTSNLCGWSDWSAPLEVAVENNIGIATHPLSGLRLWPNPATGTFNLQLPAGATLPATLALSDLSGRVVLRQTLTETLSKIDCSRLVEGVYFWRVELDAASVSGKLIIKR
jgi:hypothetical protein